MSQLHGHDHQITAFRDALDRGRIHHAWLLSGARGLGKASYAKIAACRYLAEGSALFPPGRFEVDPEHPTARLIAAGSHPDYRLLERSERVDKTGGKTGDRARNISIDQVRALQRLFATTPSLSSRRAVIVDAADDLETNAANALLKNLEEPPPETLFLLVCHNPGRLLPTIRSRCRNLRFHRLSDDVMTDILGERLNDPASSEIAALLRAAKGSPGKALGSSGLDIGEIDAAMDEIILNGDPTNAVRYSLARMMASKAAQPRYEVFLERVTPRIAAETYGRTGPALAHAIALWERARSLAAGAVSLSLDPQTTTFELASLLAALAPEQPRAKA